MADGEKQDGGGKRRKTGGMPVFKTGGMPVMTSAGVFAPPSHQPSTRADEALARSGNITALRALPFSSLTAVYPSGKGKTTGNTLAHFLAGLGSLEGVRTLHELLELGVVEELDVDGGIGYASDGWATAAPGLLELLERGRRGGGGGDGSGGDGSGGISSKWVKHSGGGWSLVRNATAGAILSAANDKGSTPAHHAAGGGHEGCLRVLHELGAGASLSAAGATGTTPAYAAAQQGHEGCLRVLYELEAGSSLSSATAKGSTPAHAAAQQGHEGCLRALHELGAGAILSAANAKGGTPAHYAVAKGHEGCLRVLHELGAGASLSAVDAGGKTPAHAAVEHGHEGCLRALHEVGAGASLSAADATGITPAHCAAQQGHEGCLRVLHELGAGASLSVTSATGSTPAFLASARGHVASIKVLHAAGADVTAARHDGWCPVSIASRRGHAHVLQVLLTTGASAAIMHNGSPPLHIAAQNGHLACVRVLADVYPAPDTWRMFLLGGGAASELASYLAPPADNYVTVHYAAGVHLLTDGTVTHTVARTTLLYRGPPRNHLPRLYGKPDMIKHIWSFVRKPRYVDLALLDGRGHTAMQVAGATDFADLLRLLAWKQDMKVQIKRIMRSDGFKTSTRLRMGIGIHSGVDLLLVREGLQEHYSMDLNSQKHRKLIKQLMDDVRAVNPGAQWRSY